MNAATQKLSSHIIVKAVITCCICNESWEGDEFLATDMDSVVKDSLDYFHRMGWREKTSGKFALIGAMCPTCGKCKDKERGE